MTNQGRIEQVGAAAEVYLRPGTRFVASFWGAINWIDGVGIRPEATRISRTAPAQRLRDRLWTEIKAA